MSQALEELILHDGIDSVTDGVESTNFEASNVGSSYIHEGATRSPYRFLLFLRFLIVNLVAGGLLISAYLQGWVAEIFFSDQTRLTGVIFGVFLVGLGIATLRILQTSRDLNEVHEFGPSSAEITSLLAGALIVVTLLVTADIIQF